MAPIFRPIYFDESSNQAEDSRIGIAASMASAHQWMLFDTQWRAVLADARLQPGDVHAARAGSVQTAMNIALARMLRDLGISSTCVTTRVSDFESVTTPAERSMYGGPYGFLRYASLLALNLTFDNAGDTGRYAYYLDQGGQGGDWFLQTLGRIAQHDELRAKYRMAGYGVVDRRVHVQVHAPDLIAHEVITSRHTSEPLKVLGDRVLVDDWTADDIRELMGDFSGIREKLNALKREHRDRMKRDRQAARQA